MQEESPIRLCPNDVTTRKQSVAVVNDDGVLEKRCRSAKACDGTRDAALRDVLSECALRLLELDLEGCSKLALNPINIFGNSLSIWQSEGDAATAAFSRMFHQNKING